MLYLQLHNQKKRRRTKATDYLIRSNNKYIRRYPEEDLVKILKDSGYHSEEWEKTDTEEEDDDDVITEESAAKEKSLSIHIYERWQRFSAVCIYDFFIYQIYLFNPFYLCY